MTIKEYYANYQTTKKYPINLVEGMDRTVAEFYDNCISKNILPKKNVLAWHKMLMEYVDRPDAIYWVRYYESCSSSELAANNNIHITRRACLVRFDDGFSIVYVSNFDAHEIFNMVRLIDNPNVEEFAELMKSFRYPLHYETGPSCEESEIKAYPNIGTIRGGVLTYKHWYLAHVNGIKEPFLRSNKDYKKISGDEKNTIFPRGLKSDWRQDQNLGQKVYKPGYTLTDEQKEIVKAHFLRFVDPLNYYAGPGQKFVNTHICENPKLNNFVKLKFEKLYGAEAMHAFRVKALIKEESFPASLGAQEINVSYGLDVRSGSRQNETRRRPISHPSSISRSENLRVDAVQGSVPEIELIPNDVARFKKALLRTLSAKRTWIYGDGRSVENTWNASKFTENSDLISNIRTTAIFKKWKENGLVKVKLVVEEF